VQRRWHDTRREDYEPREDYEHNRAFLVYLSGSLAVVGFALLVLWAGLTWLNRTNDHEEVARRQGRIDGSWTDRAGVRSAAFDNGVASLLVRIRNNSEHKSAVVYARSMEPGRRAGHAINCAWGINKRPPPFPEGAASAGVQSNPEFTVVPMHTMPTTTPPRESR
jgi:hypothetical protein